MTSQIQKENLSAGLILINCLSLKYKIMKLIHCCKSIVAKPTVAKHIVERTKPKQTELQYFLQTSTHIKCQQVNKTYFE